MCSQTSCAATDSWYPRSRRHQLAPARRFGDRVARERRQSYPRRGLSRKGLVLHGHLPVRDARHSARARAHARRLDGRHHLPVRAPLRPTALPEGTHTVNSRALLYMSCPAQYRTVHCKTCLNVTSNRCGRRLRRRHSIRPVWPRAL